MILKKPAVAGTLESSDVQIMVEPCEGKIEIIIQSSVLNQYGKQIKATIEDVLKRMDVTEAKVTVIDKGALDCTLRARLECAIFRSSEISGEYPWGDVIQ
ncbi:MAG: citrate lyase acyl carrier protein [Clostridiales bacterium]|jgi:citrate lyase subunit gamma (acyl carrier protein)|nr:citrate lyase acyl carrier protein [Clostridiales bacterium]